MIAAVWFFTGCLATLAGIVFTVLWQHRKAARAPLPTVPPERRIHRPGPYRAKPEVDVEFLDAQGQSVGSVTVELVVRIAASGLLIAAARPVYFLNDQFRVVVIHAWQLWIGDDCRVAPIEPVTLQAGDTYRLNGLNIPVRLDNDIWFGPDNGGEDDPQPTPPSPSGQKEKVQ
jgi:hypothetical protein